MADNALDWVKELMEMLRAVQDDARRGLTTTNTSTATEPSEPILQLPDALWALIGTFLRGDARALLSLARTCRTVREAVKPTTTVLQGHMKAWINSKPLWFYNYAYCRAADMHMLVEAVLPWAYDDGTALPLVTLTGLSAAARLLIHARGNQVGLGRETRRGSVVLTRPHKWKMDWDIPLSLKKPDHPCGWIDKSYGRFYDHGYNDSEYDDSDSDFDDDDDDYDDYSSD